MTVKAYPSINPALYETTRVVIQLLAIALTRGVVVEGKEFIPRKGPFVVAMNHLSFLDTPLVSITVPQRLYWLVGERYEHHTFTPIIKVTGSIFVRRGEIDREALRQALAALDAGQVLAVAVEGTRSRSGGLNQGKTGAAYLASRAGAPILPTAVWGTEEIGPAWHRWRRAGQTHIRFGQPFSLPEGRARSADLEHYTEDIMTRLAAMLPESYRGVYRDHPGLAAHLAAQPG